MDLNGNTNEQTTWGWGRIDCRICSTSDGDNCGPLNAKTVPTIAPAQYKDDGVYIYRDCSDTVNDQYTMYVWFQLYNTDTHEWSDENAQMRVTTGKVYQSNLPDGTTACEAAPPTPEPSRTPTQGPTYVPTRIPTQSPTSQMPSFSLRPSASPSMRSSTVSQSVGQTSTPTTGQQISGLSSTDSESDSSIPIIVGTILGFVAVCVVVIVYRHYSKGDSSLSNEKTSTSDRGVGKGVGGVDFMQNPMDPVPPSGGSYNVDTGNQTALELRSVKDTVSTVHNPITAKVAKAAADKAAKEAAAKAQAEKEAADKTAAERERAEREYDLI